MNDDHLATISQKLSILIALTVAAGDQKYSKSDLVQLFTQFDLANGEIATILGTSKGSVEVLKSRLKTKKGKS
jgi:hypothetical protein